MKVAFYLTIPVLILAMFALWYEETSIVPQNRDLVGVWKFEEKGADGYMYLTGNGQCYMSFRPSAPHDNGRWHFFNESAFEIDHDTIKCQGVENSIITDGVKVVEPRDPRSAPSPDEKSYSKIVRWDPHAQIMQVRIETETSSDSFIRTFTKVSESEFPDKEYIR